MRSRPRVSTFRTLAWCLALLALLGSIGLLGAACSTDSPTEPRQTPGPGTGGGGGGTGGSFNITVTVSPSEIPAGVDTPAQVTIRVRRADNGQPPPDGTTIVVTTSLGNFGDVDGDGIPDTSVIVPLFGGQAILNFFAPDVLTGTAVIQAQLQGSVGQALVQVTEATAFFVSHVVPNTGSPQGGDTVTIHGAGFDGPVRVLFGGVAAQVLSISPDRIRVITPPQPDFDPDARPETEPVDVTVTINLNEEGEATDTLPGGFIYTPGGDGDPGGVPTIFSVTPASGPNEGGTRVVIRGEGFQAPVQVIFGRTATCALPAPGVEATVESVSPTQIVVVTPAATGFGFDNTNQAVNIVVKNLNSGLCTVAMQAFRYGVDVDITSIAPGSGPASGGTLVTIFGRGFDEPVAVSIGNVGQQVISVTGTEIVIRTVGVQIEGCPPEGSVVSSGTVAVTNIETGDSDEGPTFSYIEDVPNPIISSISPTSGGENGNTLITISGSGFDAPVEVRFFDGAFQAFGSVQSVSSTQISVRTPIYTGPFPPEDCTVNVGEPPVPTPGTRNRPATVSVTVTNLDTGCTSNTSSFTYNPNDTSCVVGAAPGNGGGG